MLAGTLVGERLAACCSVLSNVDSWYWWEGRVQHEEECLIFCKTSQELFDAVRTRVLELHSYDVPEIIMIPVIQGSQEYLKWMERSIGAVGTAE